MKFIFFILYQKKSGFRKYTDCGADSESLRIYRFYRCFRKSVLISYLYHAFGFSSALGIISFILLKPVVFAQGTQTDSLFQSDSLAVNIEKPVKAAPLNAEKLAWEMMQPPGYKKQEKTLEMKSYEEILMRMKSGTAELSLILREFELTSFEKQNKKK